MLQWWGQGKDNYLMLFSPHVVLVRSSTPPGRLQGCGMSDSAGLSICVQPPGDGLLSLRCCEEGRKYCISVGSGQGMVVKGQPCITSFWDCRRVAKRQAKPRLHHDTILSWPWMKLTESPLNLISWTNIYFLPAVTVTLAAFTKG